MSFASIFYILGWLLSIFGGTMLIPAALALFYSDRVDFGSFLYSGMGTIFVGILLIFMFRGREHTLSHKDGFLLTLATWTTLSFVGALPLYFSGVAPTFIDALFESVSGLTTTGASVLSGLDDMEHGVLLWRAMLQWLGGMGIIVLAIAILPFLGIGGMQLYRSEMPGVVKDKLQPRLQETAKLLWYVYLMLTVVCAAAYNLAGMSTFDAICHAFTTIATGGYSTHDASLGYFDSPLIEAIAVVFMLAGAVNFALHFMFFTGRGINIYARDAEYRVFIILVAVSAFIIACLLLLTGYYTSTFDAFRYSIFNTVAVLTTTGYATTDYNSWPVLAPMIMLMLMFWGGCSGSTAGGMKILRIMMIIKQGGRELARLIHPRGVMHVKIGQRSVPDSVMQAVWSFAALYIVCFIVISIAMAAFGLDQITAFSAAGATLTGLGPGLGEVGPASNYGSLPQGAKLLLCFSMLLGRLELFTILIIFTPMFWKK